MDVSPQFHGMKYIHEKEVLSVYQEKVSGLACEECVTERTPIFNARFLKALPQNIKPK